MTSPSRYKLGLASVEANLGFASLTQATLAFIKGNNSACELCQLALLQDEAGEGAAIAAEAQARRYSR